MATVQDVARVARVSAVTISRFLNQPDKVAAKTAHRIRQAFDELDFVPVRRQSRRRKAGGAPASSKPVSSRRIAMVVAMHHPFIEIMSMPLLPLVVGGVIEESSRRGPFLGVAHLDDAKAMRRLLTPGFVDGIVFFGASGLADMTAEALAEFRERLRGIPHVHCFYNSDCALLDCVRVGYDSDPIGVMAAEYLHGRGHRRVVVFNDRPNTAAFALRALKFRLRAVELGMDCVTVESPEDIVTSSPATVRPMVEAVRARKWPERTGAFFCSDEVLRRVMMALVQDGFRAERFDMIGCDNDRRVLAQYAPTPASIDLHMDEIGRESVRQLFHPAPEKNKGAYAVMLPPTLVPPEEG